MAKHVSGGVGGRSDNLRVIQAMRYWDLGIGRRFGCGSFEEYLNGKGRGNDKVAPIPEIPEKFLVDGRAYPYLVLVEPRLGVHKLCRLVNIYCDGHDDDRGLVPYNDRHTDPSDPFWTRIQDGHKNHDRAPNECRRTFAKNELGLTALIGICAYLQHEQVLTDFNQGEKRCHAMALPGSVCSDDSGECYYLELKQGQAQLFRHFDDLTPPGFGSASRRV